MRDLLSEARENAERATLAVKTAALLHIARVLTKIDSIDAQRTLDEALALAATLPDGEREVLLGEGAALAATISPPQALRLVREVTLDRDSVLERVLFNMVAHGHAADAAAYLSAPPPGEPYPFGAALQTMGRGADDDTRLRVFRGAIRAMREQRSSGRHDRSRDHHGFVRLFTRHWRRLPADEATAVVRELVDWILSEPESRTNASFSSGSQRVQFSSMHEQRLFEILGPLRHLDAELAESVTNGYPALASAAARFPYGQDSMHATMSGELPRPPREPVAQPDYIDVGHRLIPIPEAIRTAFNDAFAFALNLLRDESDPEHFNEAPQECWSSAMEFRKILYKAGQHEGRTAERYLARIPDPALRLFAQIELAAALVGLPQLGGRTIRPGPGGLREMVAMRRPHASQRSGLPAAMHPLPPPRKPRMPPSREPHIAPATASADDGPSGGSGPDFVEIRNASLREMIAQLYSTPHNRIEWPPSLEPDARYDFVLVLPNEESHQTRMRLLQEGIARHFHLSIAQEMRAREVYVLTAPNGITARGVREESPSEFGSVGAGTFSSIAIGARAQPGRAETQSRVPEAMRLQEIMNVPLMPDDGDGSPEAFERIRRHMMRELAVPLGPNKWIGGIQASLTMQALCEMIEHGLDRPLLDETNLPGSYAINVQTDATTTEDFLRLLSGRLGLITTSARRNVRMLVIRLA